MIRLKDILNEVKITNKESDIANFFARNGLKKRYDKKTHEEYEQEFGPDFMKNVMEWAPKLMDYEQKIDKIAAEITASKEALMLMAIISHHKGYGGSYDQSASIRDLFPWKPMIK